MNIKLFPNKTNATVYVAKKMADIVAKKPNANFALPASRDLIDIYKAFGVVSTEQELNYAEVKIFNVENEMDSTKERQGSSYNFMTTYLYKKLSGLKKPNVFLPMLEANYDQQLEEAGGIDLLVLPLLDDGSIGYNYEGSAANSKTRKVFNTQIKCGFGATMGLATIMNAKRIILVALGKKKNDVFRKLKTYHEFDKTFPVSILKDHPNTLIVVDEEAF